MHNRLRRELPLTFMLPETRFEVPELWLHVEVSKCAINCINQEFRSVSVTVTRGTHDACKQRNWEEATINHCPSGGMTLTPAPRTHASGSHYRVRCVHLLRTQTQRSHVTYAEYGAGCEGPTALASAQRRSVVLYFRTSGACARETALRWSQQRLERSATSIVILLQVFLLPLTFLPSKRHKFIGKSKAVSVTDGSGL
jgi:hypothetical protein